MKELIYTNANFMRLPYLKKKIRNDNLSVEILEFLDDFLSNEVRLRNENSIKNKIRIADFPIKKDIRDLDLEFLPQQLQLDLEKLKSLDFIHNAENIVLIGSPGTGKTHISIGLGILACKNNLKVKFCHIPTLITQLKESSSEKRLNAFISTFLNYDLIVLDELGYVNLDKEGSELLFQLLSSRSEKKSTIITSNLNFEGWLNFFHDTTIAGALIDRVCHKAYLYNMVGDSYRIKQTAELQGGQI